jgi:hypothetical protein
LDRTPQELDTTTTTTTGIHATDQLLVSTTPHYAHRGLSQCRDLRAWPCRCRRTRVHADQIERRATGARAGPASPPDAKPNRDLSTARRLPPPGQSLMAPSHEAATLSKTEVGRDGRSQSSHFDMISLITVSSKRPGKKIRGILRVWPQTQKH